MSPEGWGGASDLTGEGLASQTTEGFSRVQFSTAVEVRVSASCLRATLHPRRHPHFLALQSFFGVKRAESAFNKTEAGDLGHAAT